jgi:periplasmic protein CpxP/Spy
MLKQRFLILVAAGIMTLAATFAGAQDNQSTPPSPSTSNDQQSSMGGDNGRRRHGPPDPAERTRELTKKLKLTSDQQTKVQAALQSEHNQMESLRQDSSLSQQDRRAKMMDIHQSTDAQIRGLLDSTQQAKWDEMQAKREQWMQKGKQGGAEDGEQKSPSPQQ